MFHPFQYVHRISFFSTVFAKVDKPADDKASGDACNHRENGGKTLGMEAP